MPSKPELVKPKRVQKYDAEKYGHYIPLNKKITNNWQVQQIQILCVKWGLTAQEVCYRLIHEGLHREQKLRDAE